MDVIVLGTTAVVLLAAIVAAVVLLTRWRRRRHRFSLRSLFLAFLVVGCVLFAVVQFLVPALHHRWAIEQIHAVGGWTMFPDDYEELRAHGSTTPRNWLTRNYWRGVASVRADNDWEAAAVAQHLASVRELEVVDLHHVTEVGLDDVCRVLPRTSAKVIGVYDSNIRGKGLSDMSDLTNVRELFFNTCQVDDAAFARFTSIPDLRQFYFLDEANPPNPPRLTDASFAEIGRFENLDLLHLSRQQASDAAARSLHGLKRLKTLRLVLCQISDQALADLREALPDCRLTRDLTGAGVLQTSDFRDVRHVSLRTGTADEAALARLAAMPDLKSLSVVYQATCTSPVKPAPPVELGEEAFSNIGEARTLEDISLRGLEISDAAARSLHGLARLKKLAIIECQISSSAVEELRRALPDCDVECWKNSEPDEP